ncbi:hypothetical protein Tco_0585221 [Tanacetum coccineum]
MNLDPDDATFEFNQIQFTPENADVNEKTVIPLFDQSLLYNNEDGKRINDIPVNTIFIESQRAAKEVVIEREGKKVVKKKVKKSTVSALEEYLKRGEEEKRKSYLQYSHVRRRPRQVRCYGLIKGLLVWLRRHS